MHTLAYERLINLGGLAWRASAVTGANGAMLCVAQPAAAQAMFPLLGFVKDEQVRS